MDRLGQIVHEAFSVKWF